MTLIPINNLGKTKMSNIKELIAQKEAIEREIKEATEKGRADAISSIKAIMEDSGITLADLGGSARKASKVQSAGAKVAPKFVNPTTGESWSGRGLKPRWMTAALAAGKVMGDFAVQATH